MLSLHTLIDLSGSVCVIYSLLMMRSTQLFMDLSLSEADGQIAGGRQRYIIVWQYCTERQVTAIKQTADLI